MADREGDREVDQAQPGLLGEHGERVGDLELALVRGQRHVVAAGEPVATACSPGSSAPFR